MAYLAKIVELAVVRDDGTSTPFYYTTWDKDISVIGKTYKAGTLLGTGGISMTAGVPDTRSSIQLRFTNADGQAIPATADDAGDYLEAGAVFSALLEQDPGPIRITTGWLKSDDGQSWSQAGPRSTAVMSTSIGRDKVVSIELETRKGEVSKRGVQYWSHEDQLRRVAAANAAGLVTFSDDQGMEYVRDLEQIGVRTNWPPPPQPRQV